MKLSLYLDEDTIARSLVAALRARGADIQTVVEAGLRGKDDEVQLEWAAANKRARQRYAVKQQIRLLLNVVKTKSAEDMQNRLLFL